MLLDLLSLYGDSLTGALDALGQSLILTIVGVTVGVLALLMALFPGWLVRLLVSRQARLDAGDDAPRVPRSTLRRVWERETLPLPTLRVAPAASVVQAPMAGCLDGGPFSALVALPIPDPASLPESSTDGVPDETEDGTTADIAADIAADTAEDGTSQQQSQQQNASQTTQVLPALPAQRVLPVIHVGASILVVLAIKPVPRDWLN